MGTTFKIAQRIERYTFKVNKKLHQCGVASFLNQFLEVDYPVICYRSVQVAAHIQH